MNELYNVDIQLISCKQQIYIKRGPHIDYNQLFVDTILLHRQQLLQTLLAAFHDSNANMAKFKTTFNGDCNDTIRFVFAIQGYEEITNFQDPNSLFINIYNSLPHHIQVEFGADKNNTITRQQNALDNNSTDQDIKNAAIYSSESMQEFFVRNYRPTIQRSTIFRHLHSIYMRRNENPRAVIDRMVAAIQYAKATIDLLNRTNPNQNDDMAAITDGDVTELLSRLFCSNNSNPGQINILVQKKFRSEKPRYDENNGGFTPFLTIANNVVADLGTVYYAKDSNYKIQHYEPLPLPLWETPRNKPKTKITKPMQTSPQHQSRKRNRFTPSHNFQSQPPNKRRRYDSQQQYAQKSQYHSKQRYTPKHRNNPQRSHQFRSHKTQCYRCGKLYHKTTDCRSHHDIDSNPLQPQDRRHPSQWPYKPQQQPNTHYSTKNHHYTNKHKQQSWRQYQSPSAKSFNQSSKSNNGQNESQTNPNTSQLLSLVTDLHDKASEDSHINPEILIAIDEIRNSITKPDPPQPRQ